MTPISSLITKPTVSVNDVIAVIQKKLETRVAVESSNPECVTLSFELNRPNTKNVNENEKCWITLYRNHEHAGFTGTLITAALRGSSLEVMRLLFDTFGGFFQRNGAVNSWEASNEFTQIKGGSFDEGTTALKGVA